MPEDKDIKARTSVVPNSKNETDLESEALDSSPLPGPVPEIEQEPQTSSLSKSTPTPKGPAAGSSHDAAVPVDAYKANPQQDPSGLDGKKKKIIFGAIVAGVLAVLLGGGALAYTLYQSPDKVVADGFVNMLSSQPHSVIAEINAENNDSKMFAHFDMRGDDKVANGTLRISLAMKQPKINIEGSAEIAATSDGDGYLKLKNVDTLAEKFVDSALKSQVEQYKQYGMTISGSEVKTLRKQMLAQINPIVEKINNRWIKFSASEDKNEVNNQQKCVTDVLKKFQNDKAMRDELSETYIDNKFVNVKEQLGLKNGSYGYVMDIDKQKVKSFGEAAMTTKFVKDLEACDGNVASGLSAGGDSSDDASNVRVELWVSQWSHQITGMKLQGTDESSAPDGSTKVTIDVTLGYDSANDVKVPTGAVDFNDLQKELDFMSPGSAASARTSEISI